MRRCTQKQERFCLKYMELGKAREAVREAGYSPKWTSRTARDVLASPQVQARLEELRKKITDDEQLAVTSIQERRERLSQIIRATIPDFVGDDGIKVTKGIPNVGAVAEITTKTKIYRKGGEPITITNLKLHNPIPAIQELNKMDGIYSENTQVNIDNRKIEVIVVSEKAKELTEAIMQGARTQLTV